MTIALIRTSKPRALATVLEVNNFAPAIPWPMDRQPVNRSLREPGLAPCGLGRLVMTGRARRRAGLAMVELLVSATLLIALISIVVPLAYRSSRLWQEARSYRLAVNELHNQLEDLTVMNDVEREQALKALKPDEQLQKALPGAHLSGEVIDDSDGKRLKLSLQWQRTGDAPPIVLIGWIQPK